MLNTLIEKIGDFNPQFYREAKGRLKGRNLLVVTSFSLLAQMGLMLLAMEELTSRTNYSRWWLNIFITLSLFGMFLWILGGMYLLIGDISQEEKQGTLGFIRLSPQSYSTILLGKIMGVPILLHVMAITALPLQLVAGLKAGIPLSLILGFNSIVALTCFLVYSVGLLYSLSTDKSNQVTAIALPVIVGFYLLIWTAPTFYSYTGNAGNLVDWLGLFYPGKMLPYLVQASDVGKLTYLRIYQLEDLSWYQLHLWRQAGWGMALTAVNLGFCSYWIWQGLKRRFSNPGATLWSKNQSYWLSTTTMGIIFGFSISNDNWWGSFAGILSFHLLLILGLTFALTNQRQILQDWARYRHQQAKENRSLVRDLLFGEKSPALLALAVNAVITGVIMLPGIVLMFRENSPVIIVSLLSQALLLVIYGLVIQLLLLRRNRSREIWAKAMMLTMIFLPPVLLSMVGLLPHTHPEFWLFVPLPLYAVSKGTFTQFILPIIFQGVIIALGSLILTKQLQRLGESEMKNLAS